MNKQTIVITAGVVALAVFMIAAVAYNRFGTESTGVATAQESSTLIRPHSPVIGPKAAKVTMVEFFDPACETCRALYPVVKDIMKQYPNDVRLIIRYTPFHKGSDEAVRILETARQQGVFVPVIEALLNAQPQWARHGAPNLNKAWEAAAAAGLDVDKARKIMMSPDITAVLNQDVADVREVGVKATPTFFVNGKPLPSFGIKQLRDLVQSEVEAVRAKGGTGS